MIGFMMMVFFVKVLFLNHYCLLTQGTSGGWPDAYCCRAPRQQYGDKLLQPSKEFVWFEIHDRLFFCFIIIF